MKYFKYLSKKLNPEFHAGCMKNLTATRKNLVAVKNLNNQEMMKDEMEIIFQGLKSITEEEIGLFSFPNSYFLS